MSLKAIKRKVKCPRQGCGNRAIVDKQYGILPCLSCQNKDSVPLSKKPMFYVKSKQDRIQRGWDQSEKAGLQPFMGNKINKEFFKAYPEQIDNYEVRKELEKM